MMTRESAEMLAIRALQFLAGDENQLVRFLALTGTEIGDLRKAAGSVEFLAGVLDHLMGDEPTLLAFAASAGIDPKDVAAAQQSLSPHGPD